MSKKGLNLKTKRKLQIGLSIVLIVSLFAVLLTPRYEKFVLHSFSWERNISVESLQTVNESGWNLPNGARMFDSKNELYGYNKVVSHYETKTRQVSEKVIVGYNTYVSGYKDLGNGTFKEETSTQPVYKTTYKTETYKSPVYKSVPEYRTKYYYEIDKWIFERKVTTKGDDKNPIWGNVILEKRERIGDRDEQYYIFSYKEEEDGENKELKYYSINYDDWLNLNKNDTIEATVTLNRITLKKKE